MIIKLPAAYDIASSYQRVADWGKVNPKPLLVIHKATEGNFYQDPYLNIDFVGMAANGIKRGAYHFFRKANNATTQAQYFCNYARGTLTAKDYIVLDMEEGGETIAQIFAWLDEVERQFTNQILIYSRKNLIDPLAAQCNTAQLTRLRSYKLWLAGYPDNPDLYASIPADYIPAGFTAWMWQYSKGIVTGILTPKGIQGGVDLDWLAPEFIARLGGSVSTIQDGYQELTRYGSAMYLWRGTPKQVQVTDNKGYLIRPSTFAGTMANVITNGDGWDKLVTSEHLPLSLAKSNGKWIQNTQFDFRPFINFQTTGKAVISSNDITDAYNLVSGTRTLIKAGYITPALSGTEAQFTARHPRTAIGITQDNKIVSLVVDGRSAISQGVTLLELANVMQEAGAWYALELDGGDSSVMIRNGFKVSKNGDLINGVRVERATVNSILIYETEQTTMRYTATAINNDTRIRIFHNTLSTSTVLGSYPAGTVFEGDVVWTATAGDIAAGQVVGDKWLQTTKPLAGWVPVIHAGKPACNLTENEPPPAGAPASIDMQLAAGSVVTVKDAAGNILWKGTA